MKKLLYIVASALSLVACKLDDNIDPNLPTDTQLTPREMLGAAQTRSYDAQTTGMYALSNIWMNCWAGNEYYFAAPMTREYQMDVSSTFYQPIWNSTYLAAANLANIINNPQASKYPLHVAVAKILMANSMQYIVDFYGDAPYSEAFKQQGNLSPKYDKGEDIYKDLVVKLNEAIQAIDNTSVNAGNEVRSSEDVIFGGDMAEWKKYANTLKLRILLRQSKVTDATIVAFRNAQLATLSGASFVDSDVTINPGYTGNSTSQQNPLFREYGWLVYDDSAYNTYGYRYFGMVSDHFAKLLNGDTSKPTSGIVDPRRSLMFRTVSGTLKGIVQGGGKVSGGAESGFSRFRWKFYNYSNPGVAGEGSSMDGYLMTKSESEFLQAEAAVLYPSIFSNAQAHYIQGVRDSFTFYGSTSDPATYLAALDSKTYGWTGATDKIAAIQYQRLVALTYTRPMETYINYLKTGYPDTPLALTATKTNKPYRLIYPSSEYTANSANVPKLTKDEVFVKNQYTPFWNRN